MTVLYVRMGAHSSASSDFIFVFTVPVICGRYNIYIILRTLSLAGTARVFNSFLVFSNVRRVFSQYNIYIYLFVKL
jgi:hypothetical protein